MHSRGGYPDLLSILATCVYLGVKVTDGPQFDRQLSGMLTHILGHQVAPDMVSYCTEKAACTAWARGRVAVSGAQ